MLALLPVVPAPTTAGGKVGSILGLFTGSATLPFAGAIAAAIVVAFGGFWAYERVQIHALNVEITTLHQSIDGPTGYIQQIGRANSNLAVANDTITKDEAALKGMNAQIDKLATDSAAAVKRTQTLAAALAAANDKAARVAATLAANKPAVASYAALTGLIKQAVGP